MKKVLESESVVLSDEIIDNKKKVIDEALLHNISGGREECSSSCAHGCSRERCESGPVLLPV